MESIGGFLPLELAQGTGRHQGGIALDLGRHALEVILRVRGYHRLFVPRFTCDVLAPAIKHSGVELVLYDLDLQLDPVLPAHGIGSKDAVLYTNYFGLKTDTVTRIASTVENLIVDAVQDFYGTAPAGVDHFVSCRKFFGVADGAYLYCDAAGDLNLEAADATGRWEHLLTAGDRGTEAGFPRYQEHERLLEDAPIRGMSQLTSRVMRSIDHDRVIQARQQNRDYLHTALGAFNRCPIDPAASSVPMVYPFLSNDLGLRARLQAARIYTANYWPGLFAPLSAQDGARDFLDRAVYLPVDQRYGIAHMDRILAVIMNPTGH
jgi:hypothetical protein